MPALDADHNPARVAIINAARDCLLEQGYANLSTRAITDRAGVPLSQLHYHFGSKQGLVLALLDHENDARLERQSRMYAEDLALWKRWEQACDFFEEDLDSGYVRVLQEMTAAGWSDDEVATAVTAAMHGWNELLVDVFGALLASSPVGPLQPDEAAALASAVFLGAETVILLGMPEDTMPLRRALRRVGDLIRLVEEQPPTGAARTERHEDART